MVVVVGCGDSCEPRSGPTCVPTGTMATRGPAARFGLPADCPPLLDVQPGVGRAVLGGGELGEGLRAGGAELREVSEQEMRLLAIDYDVRRAGRGLELQHPHHRT